MRRLHISNPGDRDEWAGRLTKRRSGTFRPTGEKRPSRNRRATRSRFYVTQANRRCARILWVERGSYDPECSITPWHTTCFSGNNYVASDCWLGTAALATPVSWFIGRTARVLKLRGTEDSMDCAGCKHSIRPGLEIVVDELKMERSHCPYCLEISSSQSDPRDAATESLSAQRDERRNKIRGQFADRLLQASGDGKVHCPLCERTLNEIDEGRLRNNEYFRCHLCCRDLATVAYQQEAYHEQRWLPVVAALHDLQAAKKCVDCCYQGAIAKACQGAFSYMPTAASNATQVLASTLRRTEWKTPDCEWESCFAVKQYRKTAGDGLQLL